MTLKGTEETLELGVAVEHESFMATMATSVCLPPKRQALVMASVVGGVEEKASVLAEGSLGLPPTLCLTRSLCTVENNRVIVEVCNASTEQCWVLKETVVASTFVIPESVFGFVKKDASGDTTVKATAVKFAGDPEVVGLNPE
ncbi:hypothetical protein PI125_g14367 [Phytophthora idaei]|nr:hypothetical protein PI125_g14367 [Phytophthora idaei]